MKSGRCSHGLNSATFATFLIRAIRIVVVLEDLATNDWQATFETIRNFPNEDNVFMFGAPISFYEQVLPSEYLHLGFSHFAVHWASASLVFPAEIKSCRISTEILPISSETNQIDKSFVPLVEELMAKRRVADQLCFLVHRGKELVAGGLLGVMYCSRGLSVVSKCWNMAQQSMWTEGIITDMEYYSHGGWMNFRGLKEIRDHVPDSLNLLYADSLEQIPFAPWSDLQQDGDVERFLRAAVEFCRGWGESFTLHWLTNARRARADAETVLELFFEVFLRKAIRATANDWHTPTNSPNYAVYQKK